MEIRKKLLIGLVILGISFLVTTMGLLSLDLASPQRVPYGTLFGAVNLSGLTLGDAKERINNYFPEFLKDRNLSIHIEGKTYQIPLKELNVSIDSETTIKRAFGDSTNGSYLRLKTVFSKEERKVLPAFVFDHKKLKEKLEGIKKTIDKTAVDAQAILNEKDVIEKKAERIGVSLSIENSLKKVEESLNNGDTGPIMFLRGIDTELIEKKPRVTLADIEKINGVVGKAYTEITTSKNLQTLKSSVNAINNIYIPAPSAKTGGKVVEFSFTKCLDREGLNISSSTKVVNQVASTLNNAISKIGVAKENISFVRDRDGEDYEPDIIKVKILGKNEDFKFKNDRGLPLIILADTKNERVNVYILGNK